MGSRGIIGSPVVPAVFAATALAAWSCGGSGGPGERGGVLVRLSGPQGEPVTSFVAVFPLAGGQDVIRVECGPETTAGKEPTRQEPAAPEGAECTGDGVRLDSASGVGDLVVKAHGYRFLHTFLAKAVDRGDMDTLQFDFVLDPLPAFTSTADYATGFTPEQGIAAFEDIGLYTETELGGARTVKFYIADVRGKQEVYFQNTKKHFIHYDFAKYVLGLPITDPMQFRSDTYVGEDRSAMAGTLVYYPQLTAITQPTGAELHAPIALTFFPSDNLTPEQVTLAHRLVEERLGFASFSGQDLRLIYLPAGTTQEQELAAAVGDFRKKDVPWATWMDLYAGVTLQLLNQGKAYGTLRLMTPEELAASVVSYSDILVLTRLPNQLPIVGGTITEELQTPLAHVNVAARTRGTPNIALLAASTDERVAPFIGELVRFEVDKGGFTIEKTTAKEAEEFWESRKKPPFSPPFDLEMEGLPGFADLDFADAVSVGVKAANLAELHGFLPDQSPDGFAIPFRYYDEFMAAGTFDKNRCADAQADCISEGRSAEVCLAAHEICLEGVEAGDTLWEYAGRLLLAPAFKQDTLVREAGLDGLRFLIGHIEVAQGLGQLLDARVAELFGDAKVRLRSSTNSEDLDDFSGAGLYDSFSAYATGDKAASSRVRKVWASVWGWRAFQEREFWSIDHMAVRMGVAVNRAFTDEQANGVLITVNIANLQILGMYVNVQLGEVPVTNPEDGCLPEIFSIIAAPGAAIQVARQRFSSLSAGVPILTDDEILALYLAADKVRKHFAPLYGKPDPWSCALDLEFKFHGPERALFVKQVRPYTQPGLW